MFCDLLLGSNNEFISKLFRAKIAGTASLALQPERYGLEFDEEPFMIQHL